MIKSPFLDFFQFPQKLHTIRTKFCTVNFDWDSGESEGKSPEPTPLPPCVSGLTSILSLLQNIEKVKGSLLETKFFLEKRSTVPKESKG